MGTLERTPVTLEEIKSKKRLQELEASGDYLFHGSPQRIDNFEPRQAYTDINGVSTPDGDPAVFTSSEIEIPIFRSIFHHDRFTDMPGSYEVGFSTENALESPSYVHANQSAIDVCKQVTGYVYVFNRNNFTYLGGSEWSTDTKVKPVAIFTSSFEDIGLPIQLQETPD